MIKARKLSLILEIIIFILLIVFYIQHSLILSTPLKFYSTFLPYRLQTNAFLQGKLSLSQETFGLPWDGIWAGTCGIQQGWGLGVSFLRLPFEWGAKLCGLAPFPDRMVLVFYLALTIFILNIALRFLLRNFGIVVHSPIAVFIRFYFIMGALFCPPMSGLIQFHLSQYEDAIFYGCMYSYVLLSLLLIHTVKPSNKIFFGVCLASGFAWLIRPTLISYGLVTFVLAVIQVWQEKRGFRLIVIGTLCFCLGVLTDLWFNYLRFGEILEFGYRGTVTSLPTVIYMSRFGYPYQGEPFLFAFKELMGVLFFNFQWESHTFRYRVHSFSPFNLSHLIVLGTGGIVFLLMIFGILRKKLELMISHRFRVIYFLLSWGFICFFLVFVFYMHAISLEDRYFAEFAVAFNAILMALIMLGYHYMGSYWHWKKGKVLIFLFFIILGVLFYFNDKAFFTYKDDRQNNFATDKKGAKNLVDSFYKETSVRASLPETFHCKGSDSIPGLYFQFTGWNIKTDCSVFASTVFFLPSKNCISLNYSIQKRQQLPPTQVKRDFTFLKLVDTKIFKEQSDLSIITQRFCSDAVYSSKPALYSIAWVTPDKLNNNNLPITLNWASLADERGLPSQ